MPNLVTPAEAAALLLRRREARASLASYVEYLDLGFVPARHHRLLCTKLEALARREIKKLAVFMPPGSAKSTYGSVFFPAWYLGKFPTDSILACSHTQTLADIFGRRVRNLFSSPVNTSLFGVSIAKDSQAASHWSTDRDGEYFGAGVGVAVSGRRCDIGLIDDPVANREEADSMRAQERQWDWWVNDFMPRLKPNAAQVLIQTRWSEGDLAGRILDREGDEWEIIELAMEAREDDPLNREIGERLWPEWFTEKMVSTAKLDARSWSALYQQRPIADEGDYFRTNWFQTEYDQVPDNVHYYGASDYAVTEGHGDFTEHGVFALDPLGNLYVVDWWSGQTTSDVWIEHQCDLIKEYEPMIWFGESGPIRRSVEPYLTLRMLQRRAACRLEWLPSLADKTTRARPFQALSSMGKVFLPKYAPWKAGVLEQLTHFPAGKRDDKVDTCSLVGRGLNLVSAPRVSKYQPRYTPMELNSGAQSWLLN